MAIMKASIHTETQHSQIHASTTHTHTHTHTHIPQSSSSINIQGEWSLEWVCISAALTSKRQREKERMAEKSKKTREWKWQWAMEGKRPKKVNSGGFDSWGEWDRVTGIWEETGVAAGEDEEEEEGLRKWHLDISQKTNSNPGHSYDKLKALISTTVGRKLTSAERSGWRNQRSRSSLVDQSNSGVTTWSRKAVITFVSSNIKGNNHSSCQTNEQSDKCHIGGLEVCSGVT